MKRIHRCIPVVVAAVALLVASSPPAHAAVPALLTVGMVRQALLDSIQSLDSAMQGAAQSTKAIGNSLEANARGVVADIDRRLGDRLDQTFDRLDDSEKRFMEDAQALVGQVDTAAHSLVTDTEGSARRVLGDADILAYNTLYSLPCRDQVPRVVYTTPEVVYEGYTLPEVVVHGNFLDLGAEPKVEVDGQAARVVARAANQVRVALPAKVANGVASGHSVGVRFRGTSRLRSCYLFGLIPWTREHADRDLAASVLLQPKTTVKVAATLVPVVSQRETASWAFGDNRGTGDNCDEHFDAAMTYCIPEGWGGRLVPGAEHSAPGVASKNCDSDIEGVDVVGDRCVRVRAHVGGCGYDQLLFVRNCRGRGWLNYGITLNGERFVPVDGSPFQKDLAAEVPVKTNVTIPYGGDLAGQTPSKWRYQASVSFYRGSTAQPIRSVELTDTDPVVAGIASRLDEGTLAIDYAQVVSGLFATAP